ncbi:MAG TPA: outer membrane protein [Stellaceae bacterium]|jgi:outer membrane immunogenic protein|nr:outer membrane protein [Stellaceae bacterium]
MKHHWEVAVAVAVLFMPLGAEAQDWSGPEVGIQGGGVWGTSSGVGTSPYNTNVQGGLGGGHGGYNFQFGQILVGFEGDAEVANVLGPVHGRMSFDASARGKLGWAWGQWLPYATGGAAFGNVKSTYSVLGSSDGVRLGWTVGAGLDYAIDQNWEAGIEYRYTDLGHKSFSAGAFHDDNEFNFNAVRLNLTYRFGPLLLPN